jgi:toxin ParE1/3/4
MAQIVWTVPALADLEAIAEYIALDKPTAARDLVNRVVAHIEQLAAHPASGSKVLELPRSRYRQIVEPPCRIFYRVDGKTVYVLHVLRAERLLRPTLLSKRTITVKRER